MKGTLLVFGKKKEGKNTPYSIDEVDTVIVDTVNGQIILNKEYLIKNKILKSDTCKGKLGFRIKVDDSIKFALKK